MEPSGDGVKVGGICTGRAVGVSSGEEYRASVINLGYEALGEEAVGSGERIADDVRKGFDYACGLSVMDRWGADDEETVSDIEKRGDLFRGVILFYRDL